MSRYILDHPERKVEVDIEDAEGRSLIRLEGHELEIDWTPVSRDALSLRVGNASYLAHLSTDGEEVLVKLRGRQFRFPVFSEREWHYRNLGGGSGAGGGKSDSLLAPMPGKVLEVRVSVGDLVEEGQGLVILEAMKMENVLKAPASLRVVGIEVEAGQAVEGDAVLLRFAPPEEGSDS